MGKEDDVLNRITTIPDVFYGGNNPAVYNGSPSSSGQTAMSQRVSRGKPNISPRGLPEWVHAKWFHITGVVFFFAIAIGGITWYYVKDLFPSVLSGIPDSTLSIDIPVVSPPVSVPVPPATENTTSSEFSTTTETPLTNTNSLIFPLPQTLEPLVFPGKFSVQSADVDNDALTDLEEEVFGTDSGNPDTDADGYNDGQEVANLYNPAGVAPVKIIDSALVREYMNPRWQYRIYYPTVWAVGEVDENSEEILVSSIDGEYIEVRVFDGIVEPTFTAWFGIHATGQQYQDLSSMTNRFQQSVWVRDDGLVGYVFQSGRVIVLLYRTGIDGIIRYPHIMNMVIQSFRPRIHTEELPDQVILPPAPVLSTDTLSQP